MSVFKKAKSFATGSVLGVLAGALVGGPLGAAAGGLLGGYTSYSSANDANKQKKALAEANAYDRYTWDLMNAYNDPKAQMYRLKSAGLNPNLVYGSGNVTGNTTGMAGSNGVANVANGDSLSRGLSMAQSLASLRNTNTQNELLKYQMGQTAAQTAFAKAKTRDLNNFLTGKGPTTYNRYQTSSTQEPNADPEVDDYTLSDAFKDSHDVLMSLLPSRLRGFIRSGEKTKASGHLSNFLLDKHNQFVDNVFQNSFKKYLNWRLFK